jgi:hypothetical protein
LPSAAKSAITYQAMLVVAVILLGMREDLDAATETLEQWRVAYYHGPAK